MSAWRKSFAALLKVIHPQWSCNTVKGYLFIIAFLCFDCRIGRTSQQEPYLKTQRKYIRDKGNMKSLALQSRRNQMSVKGNLITKGVSGMMLDHWFFKHKDRGSPDWKHRQLISLVWHAQKTQRSFPEGGLINIKAFYAAKLYPLHAKVSPFIIYNKINLISRCSLMFQIYVNTVCWLAFLVGISL